MRKKHNRELSPFVVSHETILDVHKNTLIDCQHPKYEKSLRI